MCVLSDGAGSAKHSDRGSQIAVAESVKWFRGLFEKAERPQTVIRDFGAKQGEWLIGAIREEIAQVAINQGEPEHEFAATLLVAVISKHRSVFYQVGDGAWCACKSGILGAVTWPEQGEFAGQTTFITSDAAMRSLQFIAVEGGVDFVMGMTDGLERLSLNLQGRFPHSGFCEPLISALREAGCVSEFTVKLELFLTSPRVCDRTDDDKSLALVVYEDDI
jgi:hypothetical protein